MAERWREYAEQCCGQLGDLQLLGSDAVSAWWQLHKPIVKQFDSMHVLSSGLFGIYIQLGSETDACFQMPSYGTSRDDRAMRFLSTSEAGFLSLLPQALHQQSHLVLHLKDDPVYLKDDPVYAREKVIPRSFPSKHWSTRSLPLPKTFVRKASVPLLLLSG